LYIQIENHISILNFINIHGLMALFCSILDLTNEFTISIFNQHKIQFTKMFEYRDDDDDDDGYFIGITTVRTNVENK